MPFPVKIDHRNGSSQKLTVEGELEKPLTIKIIGFEKGRFTVTKESVIPVYNKFDPRTGIESKPYWQAINVTWEFTKAGISFDTQDATYVSNKEGARIIFTKEEVRMDGVEKIVKRK